MKPSTKIQVVLFLGLVGLVSQSLAKTVSSSSKSKKVVESANAPLPPTSKKENVFLRLAKSVALEALSELREEGRRNPRFGMSFDFGNATSFFNSNETGNGTLEGLAALAGVPIAIKVSSLGLKGAILGGLVGLKAFIIQVAISILWLAFLISGTAYFVCNLGLVSCGGLGGGLGGGGGAGGLLGGLGSLGGGGGSGHSSGGGSFFGTGPSAQPPYGGGGSGGSLTSGFSNPLSFFSSRAGAAAAQQLAEQATPIYKAVDEGYKKYQ